MSSYRLNREELAPFLEKSDMRGLWMLTVNWALIAFAFALPILWFNALTVLFGLLLLANRQLGLAILMHESAHFSLFRTRALNQVLGQWLCGAPILVQLDGYRRYHLQHHRDAGTTDDPDYPNYRDYPVSRTSMRRKIVRDLTGQTGIRNLLMMIRMNLDVARFNLSYKDTTVSGIPGERHGLAWRLAPLLVNVAMLGVLAALGHAAMYLLWVVAYLVPYSLIMRIRNAAEHAAVPDLLDRDPRRHARTTYARWWERLTVAPNYVNYHLEHHWQPAVPCYRLRDFHRYLLRRGLLDDAEVVTGYGEVVRRLLRTDS
jgi:fatty acid desaturase